MADISRWNAMQVEKMCDWAKVVAKNSVTALTERVEDRAFSLTEEEYTIIISFLENNSEHLAHVIRTTIIKEGVQSIL